MDFEAVVKNRYSCRSYSDKKVDKEIITKLLTMANLAPSAANGQNRQFVVVTDKTDRDWLGKMNNQEYLAEAPVDILVTTKLSQETVEDYLKSLAEWEMTVNGVDPKEVKVDVTLENEVREMKYKWMMSDAAAAVENLLLAATSMGLATCWIGIMDFEGVRKRFNIPEGYVPVCIITLGYEKEKPKYRSKRKEIGELVHWEKW
jgi:nitroreductase